MGLGRCSVGCWPGSRVGGGISIACVVAWWWGARKKHLIKRIGIGWLQMSSVPSDLETDGSSDIQMYVLVSIWCISFRDDWAPASGWWERDLSEDLILNKKSEPLSEETARSKGWKNLRMLAKLTLQLEPTWQRADYCACASDVSEGEGTIIRHWPRVRN